MKTTTNGNRGVIVGKYDEPVPGEPYWVKHAYPWQQRMLRKRHAREWAEKERRSLFPLYIRFGDLPEAERSTTYLRPPSDENTTLLDSVFYPLRGLHENGVCCFRAREDREGGFELDVSENPGFARTLKILEYRPAYLLTGIEVGKGMTGEPLLKDVAAVPLPPSARIYPYGHHPHASAEIQLLKLGSRLLGL